MSELAVLDALLRYDFYSFYRKCFHTVAPWTHFVSNWHVKAIAHCLIQVQRGEITRLVVNLPPRSGKLVCVSVAYVAWLLGHNPTLRVIDAACERYRTGNREHARRMSLRDIDCGHTDRSWRRPHHHRAGTSQLEPTITTLTPFASPASSEEISSTYST
jgi:hypothetical protein